jgi:putative Mg2+ transporter-C (MgtC) family protein
VRFTISWEEIALRIALAVFASGIIGINRDERGRPAGLRTNILVGLAACIAMIQANLLMHATGKSNDSFSVMDIMRLPLGILSGIGFIGAGAIIKRGDAIVGLTTAATLWFVTVMGLCFGGGQIRLGLASFALGFITLTALKYLERSLPQDHSGALTVALPPETDEADIESILINCGLRVTGRSMDWELGRDLRRFQWNVRWRGKRHGVEAPPVIRQLAENLRIRHVEFRM